MRSGWTASFFAIVTTFAFAPDAIAQAHSPSKQAVSHGNVRGAAQPGTSRAALRGRVAYAPRALTGHKAHFVDLVGDPDSGLGFYPLPVQYRIGAWRYRQRHQGPPWLNPVYSTIAADAVRTPGFIPADKGYQYGVFNPIDGVGTPFFAGYYR